MFSDEEYDSGSSSEQDVVVEDQFLDKDDLESEMDALIHDVQSVLQVPKGTCRILLHKFKWNKSSLLEKFYDSPDTEAFLIDAQVTPKVAIPVSKAKKGDCDICCMHVVLSGLKCNHLACKKCWKQYLVEKIVEGGCSEIECMAPDCKLLIEDEKIKFFIKDRATLAKHQQLVMNSFVDTCPLLKWCPGQDCGKAVKVSDPEPRLISCPCGTQFCFSCSKDWHAPADCRHMRMWEKKAMDDSETMNWINANTKDCPKCSVQIEKNGGCNHMRCTNLKCKFQFCWMCLGDWLQHGVSGYNCNRYDPKQSTRQDHKEVLNRYLFFFNRVENHKKSLQLEAKLKEKVAQKMSVMQELGHSWIQVQYLKDAVQTLSDGRRTIMHSYVHCFYLKTEENMTLVFESNQSDLEMAIENLSGYLERDLEEKDLAQMKLKVQDLCRYVIHRRKMLLDQCAEGHEQGSWVYNE